eukprot:GHVN01005542.1.p1 GENE.GHVN01005542.1~~GHVN01005542.1.p1  ORF type:complete len:133 (+),score=17.99 GHVN01005542.1:2-400(+)
MSSSPRVSQPYSTESDQAGESKSSEVSVVRLAKGYIAITRMQRQIGTHLLFWPGACSIALGSVWKGGGTLTWAAMSDPNTLSLLGLFAVGSFFMRGAGCIVNDLWDVEFDRKVSRTAVRPLAAKTLSRKEGE